MECLGGVGYVEEGPMPLLYREAPAELDLGGLGQRDLPRRAADAGPGRGGARARSRPSSAAARGRSPRYDAGMDDLAAAWPDEAPEAEARWFVERLATLLAASVLLREGAEPVAEAYVATRVAGEGGRVAGRLAGADRPARR